MERSVRIVMRHETNLILIQDLINLSQLHMQDLFHILTLIYLELVFRLWANTL